MREPYQRRDFGDFGQVRREQMRGLNFRDYIVYRYALPNRLSCRTPGDKLVRAALRVIRDPEFPANPMGRDDLMDYIMNADRYKEDRSYNLKYLMREYSNYEGWLSDLKSNLSHEFT